MNEKWFWTIVSRKTNESVPPVFWAGPRKILKWKSQLSVDWGWTCCLRSSLSGLQGSEWVFYRWECGLFSGKMETHPTNDQLLQHRHTCSQVSRQTSKVLSRHKKNPWQQWQPILLTEEKTPNIPRSVGQRCWRWWQPPPSASLAPPGRTDTVCWWLCAEPTLTCVIFLKSLSSHMVMIKLFPIHSWGNWGSEKLSDLSNITQLICGREFKIGSVILSEPTYGCLGKDRGTGQSGSLGWTCTHCSI